MLAEFLISDNIPELRPSDIGQKAIGYMDVYRVSNLPVVKDREYLGLISDKQIYDLNILDEPIEKQIMQLHTPHVHSKQHIIEVASIMMKLEISVLPVVDEEGSYLGAITLNQLSRRFVELLSFHEPGGIIILQTTEHNYSFTQISQIIEGNDARILSMFTSKSPSSGVLNIILKLDKVDLSPVIQTFERYEYQIAAVYMDDSMVKDLYQDRMEQFLRYLEI